MLHHYINTKNDYFFLLSHFSMLNSYGWLNAVLYGYSVINCTLGFTLGDELGFKESLSNVESNKRRSVQGGSRFQALAAQAQQAKVVSIVWLKIKSLAALNRNFLR